MDFLFISGFLMSSFSLIYRGWLFMISDSYRYTIIEEWKLKAAWFKYLDITASVSFMAVEVLIILYYTEII